MPLIMTKRQGYDAIMAAVKRYAKTRQSIELETIQSIVDGVNASFVLRIPNADGIPTRIIFKPSTAVPVLGGPAPASAA